MIAKFACRSQVLESFAAPDPRRGRDRELLDISRGAMFDQEREVSPSFIYRKYFFDCILGKYTILRDTVHGNDI